MSENNYIVIDWGSTNIRAFLCLEGKVKEVKKSPQGVTTVRGAACEGVFDSLCQPWFDKYGPLKTVMAGMVGSVNGWIDAPYLNCPVDLSELATKLTPVPHSRGLNVNIIPGLCVQDPHNYNVIRGEETQLAGACASTPCHICIMPGTHCKWVLLDSSRVESFRTAMTGELHHLLMQYSLIGLGTPEQESSAIAFEQGLHKGFEENNLAAHLFEVRAANILHGIKPSQVSEFLSGLLIGAEIASMQKIFKFTPQDGAAAIIANPFLTQRYQQGLALAGIESVALDGDKCFLNGIMPIAAAI